MNNIPAVIAGSGRSGTTWVLDVIAQANGLRTIFEPFHPIGVPAAKLFAHRYVRDDEYCPDLKAFMDKVFSGNLKSLWANYRVRPDRLKPDLANLGSLKANYKKLVVHYLKHGKVSTRKKIIVKFIRANLMFGWLSKNYQPRIILLVRHPGAVAASKMQLGGPDWSHEKTLKVYMENEKLLYDYLYKVKDKIFKPSSPIVGHTVVWCIENMIPLLEAQKKGYCVTFYEDLILNGQKEWRRIMNFLSLNAVPDREILFRPSQQASREMRIKTFNHDQVTKWMNNFSKSDLAEIQRILKIFEVPFYSAFEPTPIAKI